MMFEGREGIVGYKSCANTNKNYPKNKAKGYSHPKEA